MKIDKSVVIAITGASSGIGRAVAVAAARRGARVGLLARRAEMLEEAAAECRHSGGEAVAIACDVTDRAAFEEAIEGIVERFGRIDVLVNNAGRGHLGYVDDTPGEQIESIFRVNVFSLWYGTSAALRHMRAQRSGVIVNVASIAGKLGYPGNAAYVAAKHAVVGFSRALRTELVESGIEVVTVIPAGVTTDWALATEGGSMLELFAHESSEGARIARERGIEPTTLALMSPEEIAAAILEAIEHPAPEVYTHAGTHELVLRAEADPLEHEREQAPFWLANRDGYDKLVRRRRGE